MLSGARQGDPSAPLIFMIALEFLARLIDCRTNAFRLSVYADDMTIMFTNPNVPRLYALHACFADFSAASEW